MIQHTALGLTSVDRHRVLFTLIKRGVITLGGHRPRKIYGRLNCRAGKRMKAENRIFFSDESEAIENGYRPCAVCMPAQYRAWKQAVT